MHHAVPFYLIQTCCQLSGLNCLLSSVQWNYLVFRETFDICTWRNSLRYRFIFFSFFFTFITLYLPSIFRAQIKPVIRSYPPPVHSS